MAIKVIASCDRCKKQFEAVSEWTARDKFNRIKIELTQYNSKEFLLCDECMNKYGLMQDKKVKSIDEQRVQDKLYDLIYDIACDAANDTIAENR